MFGWLKRKAQFSIIKQMEDDLDRFLVSIRGTDAHDIGTVMAIATHWRHIFKYHGVNLLEPIAAEQKQIFLCREINKLITTSQKNNKPEFASGLMVWLHTVRAATTPEIRLKGRMLWGELRRGFPHVEDGALLVHQLTGVSLETDGYSQIPQDLNPEFA